MLFCMNFLVEPLQSVYVCGEEQCIVSAHFNDIMGNQGFGGGGGGGGGGGSTGGKKHQRPVPPPPNLANNYEG